MNESKDIGRLEGTVSALRADVIRVEKKLDEHINDESGKLDFIRDQLSLGRVVWLFFKATVLTVAFLLAFKFGDIAGLWKALK